MLDWAATERLSEKEISDTHGRNRARQIPAAPLVHDASSLLLPPIRPPPTPTMIGDPREPIVSDSRRKPPNRPSRSCKVCRLRKVKVRISISAGSGTGLLGRCALVLRSLRGPWSREEPSLPYPALTSQCPLACCLSLSAPADANVDP